MPNDFCENTPNLAKNEFEVYYNCSPSVANNTRSFPCTNTSFRAA